MSTLAIVALVAGTAVTLALLVREPWRRATKIAERLARAKERAAVAESQMAVLAATCSELRRRARQLRATIDDLEEIAYAPMPAGPGLADDAREWLARLHLAVDDARAAAEAADRVAGEGVPPAHRPAHAAGATDDAAERVPGGGGLLGRLAGGGGLGVSGPAVADGGEGDQVDRDRAGEVPGGSRD